MFSFNILFNTNLFKCFKNHSWCYCWRVNKIWCWNFDNLFTFHKNCIINNLWFYVIVIFFASTCKIINCSHCIWPFCIDKWHNFISNIISWKFAIFVCFVFDIRNIIIIYIFSDFIFGCLKHWSDINAFTESLHTFCSANPRTAQNMKQNGFCLVFHMMSKRNFIYNIFFNKRLKNAISCFSCCRFKRLIIFNSKFFYINFKFICSDAKFSAIVYNKKSIWSTCITKTMVNCNSNQFKIIFFFDIIKVC